MSFENSAATACLNAKPDGKKKTQQWQHIKEACNRMGLEIVPLPEY